MFFVIDMQIWCNLFNWKIRVNGSGAGSVLSGGGSVPAKRASPKTWVNMVNKFQKGSLSTRLGIPMIYGIDAVHGHNTAYNATIFPHNIGLGATRQVVRWLSIRCLIGYMDVFNILKVNKYICSTYEVLVLASVAKKNVKTFSLSSAQMYYIL